MEEGPINHWKFKYGGFILHIFHSFFDKMLYYVYVHSTNDKLCHPSNGFVNIKLAYMYIIAIKGWILTSTIFWLDI
jgi:hypothetical protein